MISYNINYGREDVLDAQAEASMSMDINVRNLHKNLILEGCLAGLVLLMLVLVIVMLSSIVTICFIAVCLVTILVCLICFRTIMKHQLKKNLRSMNPGGPTRYDVDDSCIRISRPGASSTVSWASLRRFGMSGNFLILIFEGERTVLFDQRELPQDVMAHLWSLAAQYGVNVQFH